MKQMHKHQYMLTDNHIVLWYISIKFAAVNFAFLVQNQLNRVHLYIVKWQIGHRLNSNLTITVMIDMTRYGETVVTHTLLKIASFQGWILALSVLVCRFISLHGVSEIISICWMIINQGYFNILDGYNPYLISYRPTWYGCHPQGWEFWT